MCTEKKKEAVFPPALGAAKDGVCCWFLFFFFPKDQFSAFLPFSGFSGKAWKIKPRVMGHSCVPALRCSIGDQLSWLRNGEHGSHPLFPVKGKSIPSMEQRCLGTGFSHSLSVGGFRFDEEILSSNYCSAPLSQALKSLRRQLEGLELKWKRCGRSWAGWGDEVISGF